MDKLEVEKLLKEKLGSGLMLSSMLDGLGGGLGVPLLLWQLLVEPGLYMPLLLA